MISNFLCLSLLTLCLKFTAQRNVARVHANCQHILALLLLFEFEATVGQIDSVVVRKMIHGKLVDRHSL